MRTSSMEGPWAATSSAVLGSPRKATTNGGWPDDDISPSDKREEWGGGVCGVCEGVRGCEGEVWTVGTLGRLRRGLLG